jgi:hypothetical protein
MLPQQTAGVALPLPEEAGSLRATFFMNGATAEPWASKRYRCKLAGNKPKSRATETF